MTFDINKLPARRDRGTAPNVFDPLPYPATQYTTINSKCNFPKFPADVKDATWNADTTRKWNNPTVQTASGIKKVFAVNRDPDIGFKLTFQNVSKGWLDNFIETVTSNYGTGEPYFFKNTDNRIQGQRLTKNNGVYTLSIPRHPSPLGFPILIDNLMVYNNGTPIAKNKITGQDGVITLNLTDAETGTITADFDFYYPVTIRDNITYTHAGNNRYNISVSLDLYREGD